MLLTMRSVTKRFPGVTALDQVSFDLREGEVHALVGANGAGKSTLIKVLSGAHQPDDGEIRFHGQPVQIDHPAAGRALGISVIYQEFTLFPALSVAANLYFGHEPRRGWFLDTSTMEAESARLLRLVGLDVSPSTLVRELGIAQQQLVEIAKALSWNAKVLVMDEPTAALTQTEVENLFLLISQLRGQGMGIIYISHRLDEVLRVADRISVLRNGRLVDAFPTTEATKERLIAALTGKHRQAEQEAARAQDGPAVSRSGPARLRTGADRRGTPPFFEVRHLCRGSEIKDVSFSIDQGEVLGIAGLMGSGRTEIVRAIFGSDPIDSGEIRLEGRVLQLKSPVDAVRAGIGLLPEDRKSQGLLMNLDVRGNISFPNLDQVASGPFIRRSMEREMARNLVRMLVIRVSGLQASISSLSGGNQQKVVLGKWLARHCRVLLLDEPTRGIDVEAKEEIYRLIGDLAREGKAILFISSELEEVLRVSDRILMLRDGEVVGELTSEGATMELVMSMVTGGGTNGKD